MFYQYNGVKQPFLDKQMFMKTVCYLFRISNVFLWRVNAVLPGIIQAWTVWNSRTETMNKRNKVYGRDMAA